MDFKKLADKAKDAIDKRGGVESLKADAEELKTVAKGEGSLTDKAKAAPRRSKSRERGRITKRNPRAKCTPGRGPGTRATLPAQAAHLTNDEALRKA